MTIEMWNIKIYDLKQDGSPNLQVEVNKPHILEVWVVPLSPTLGSVSNYFDIYNNETDEIYRSPKMVPGSGGQFVNVKMDNVGALNKWGITYYKEGTLRTRVHMDSEYTNIWINFTQIDPCEGIVCNDYCKGTTLYNNGKCIDGECHYSTIENAIECEYIQKEPTNISSLIMPIGLAAILYMLVKK